MSEQKKNRIWLELTDSELRDLDVLIDCCYDAFDFHGDLTDMKIPLDKLAKEVNRALGTEKEA